jgi:hypothetical protein
MEVRMTQRAPQPRKGRDGNFGAPLGSGGRGDRFWPTIAMIAIVIATAGWTTVAVMALSGRGSDASPSPAQVADASPSDDTSLPSDALDSPVPESHDAPALEALLPKTLNGTTLTSQSVTGDTLLSDDDWSNAFSTFLTSAGKTPTDLLFAQAYDPSGATDLTIGAYQITGVSAADVDKTVVKAWKANDSTLTTKSATVGGKKVTQGAIPSMSLDGYWYEHGDVVFEVQTSDATVAASVLAALP